MKRVQTLFRLFEDDLETFKAKVVGDKVSLQKVMEALVKEYLKDNKEVMKIVRKYANIRNDKRRRYSVDELEAGAIMKRLQEVSPLRDIEIALDEVAREGSYRPDK
jgi:superfamily I DNA and RNA helicase